MKCLCNHCSTPLEFEDSHVGESITCPECNLETVLYMQTSRESKTDSAPKPSPDTKKPAKPDDPGPILRAVEIIAQTIGEIAISVITAIGALFFLFVAWNDAGTVGLLLWSIFIVNLSYLREIRRLLGKISKQL